MCEDWLPWVCFPHPNIQLLLLFVPLIRSVRNNLIASKKLSAWTIATIPLTAVIELKETAFLLSAREQEVRRSCSFRTTADEPYMVVGANEDG